EFHIANSIKNLLATSFVILSVMVFGLGGLIAWPQAMVMMLGSTLGGYAGGRLAKRVNPDHLRRLVIVFGLVLSAVYLIRLAG
ncbi:MAG: sulfite exporter TauE/SafE family protein, partial [Pseudomonadota bacterium]